MAKAKVPRPSAGMKVKKNGDITFQSNVDHAKFTMSELVDAANRDVGRFIRKLVGNELTDLYKDEYVKGSVTMERTGTFDPKYAKKSLAYWARKKEHDLLVGFKMFSWYGTTQELGDFNYPKKGILRKTVMENVGKIREIQAQYLAELKKELPRIPEDTGDD